MGSSTHILPSYREKWSRWDEAGEAGPHDGGGGVGEVLTD